MCKSNKSLPAENVGLPQLQHGQKLLRIGPIIAVQCAPPCDGGAEAMGIFARHFGLYFCIIACSATDLSSYISIPILLACNSPIPTLAHTSSKHSQQAKWLPRSCHESPVSSTATMSRRYVFCPTARSYLLKNSTLMAPLCSCSNTPKSIPSPSLQSM